MIRRVVHVRACTLFSEAFPVHQATATPLPHAHCTVPTLSGMTY